MADDQVGKTPRAARKRGRGADTEQTKSELLDAAFESLRTEGFRGTTARSIAAISGSNQAAIYYHFGGMDELLLQALRRSSEQRLARYEQELNVIGDLPEMVLKLEALYNEDVETGHMAVLAEQLGGVTATPAMREGLVETTRPWLEFVEAKVTEAAASHPLGAFVPAADVADLVFSLVTGLELRNKLDGSTDRAKRLFRMAHLLASVAPTNSGTKQ